MVPKPAIVRFYVDADMLGLAQVLAALRPDVTFPGDPGAHVKNRTRPACPVVTPAAKDPDWIPVVASEGWLILTRDRAIQSSPAEIAAVLAYEAKLVTLAGKEAGGTWQQLEIVMSCWRQIEVAAEQPGPFIRRATRSGLSSVELPNA